MRYSVRFLPRADADVRQMLQYLMERSPNGAHTWLTALDRAVDRLRESADTYSEALESERFTMAVRQLPFKTRRGLVYRLIYTIVEQEVRILRVRGPGQAPIEPGEADSQGANQ